ncbi:MAG: pyridoxal 5'-phosphate synthase glutaminase subunit PdxT [Candidatus Levyibacteriota bacterium]
MVIGVLALQGDFLEHIQTLTRLGVATKEVRLPKDLEKIDGLIMPGGESTTMANLLDTFAMRDILVTKIKNGLPVWGTCAGMILLAKKLHDDRPIPLGVMDIEIARNAFGRQVDSFEEDFAIKNITGGDFHAVFIRAPIVKKVGENVVVLGKISNGTIIAVQEKNMLATAFHPELTADTRFHAYFLHLVLTKKSK